MTATTNFDHQPQDLWWPKQAARPPRKTSALHVDLAALRGRPARERAAVAADWHAGKDQAHAQKRGRHIRRQPHLCRRSRRGPNHRRGRHDHHHE
jgi:hypothetical protein